jgi:DNA modification methylase
VNIEQVKIDKLIPYCRNSRTHSDAQIAQIAGSIKEFGFTNPVLIDETGSIIAGHGRVLAARKLAITDVPSIRLTHLTDTQKKAYIIADNKLALNAGWDDEMLAVELLDLKDMGFDLDLTGFSPDEIEALLAPAGAEGLTDEDAVPEVPEAPVTVLGDVWLLGKHRVMCGDSTSIDAVEKLMDGQKADMVFTDPPYGMNLDTDYTKMAKTKIKSKKYDRVIGDDKDFDASVMLGIFNYVQEIFLWGADFYYLSLPKGGSWIIWDKRSEASDGLTGNHFETLWSKTRHRRRIIRHLWAGFRARNEDTKRVHPTEKPVKVLQDVMGEYSKIGNVVVDLFGGSGSTLIACEKTGRINRSMELDPKYCDVIVQRWQEFTGQTATLEETGKPFISLKKAA